MPENWRTYLAILAVAVFKNSLNKNLTFWQAITSTFVAVGFAISLTPGFVAWLQLQAVYEPGAAALIALLGEHIALMLLRSKSLEDLIAIIRGTGPK